MWQALLPLCGSGRARACPSWSLTHAVEGKTHTTIIPAAAVPQTLEQMTAYRRFRRLIRELVEISKQLCDDQLKAPQAASIEAAKKGASRAPSSPRSTPRSTR